jgi:hypothetical protein
LDSRTTTGAGAFVAEDGLVVGVVVGVGGGGVGLVTDGAVVVVVPAVGDGNADAGGDGDSGGVVVEVSVLRTTIKPSGPSSSMR